MPARRVIKFAPKQNMSSPSITFQKPLFVDIVLSSSHKAFSFLAFVSQGGKSCTEPLSVSWKAWRWGSKLVFVRNVYLHCFFLLLSAAGLTATEPKGVKATELIQCASFFFFFYIFVINIIWFPLQWCHHTERHSSIRGRRFEWN